MDSVQTAVMGVHLETFSSTPVPSLVVMWDSSGEGLGNRDSNVFVTGQGIVLHGTVTLPAEDCDPPSGGGKYDDHH